MATRRMFTKSVTDDDHFMEMSSSAQALYLHLTMAADDDGFCNQVSASMFKAHASVSDLETLLKNRYIYQFENGVIVIKHWRMANALRKDRYTQTRFKEELSLLALEENGAYTVNSSVAEKAGYNVVAKWLPDGCQEVAACLPQVRLGKDSVGKDNIPPLPPKGGEDTKKRPSREPEPETMFSGELLAAVVEWLDYKWERNKSNYYKETGYKSLITQLGNCARDYGEAAVAQVIRDSMANNYQGICFGELKKGARMPETVYSEDSKAYRAAKYFADQKLADYPDRSQPTDADLQKWAKALEELHTQNGVKWQVMADAMFFACENQWWCRKVQSAYDFKRYFNEIFADMVKEQGAVKED